MLDIGSLVNKSNYPRATGVLQDFMEYVVKKAKGNLSSRKMGNSELSKSIKYKISKQFNKNNLGKFTGGSSMPSGTISFNYYGEFVDQGVKGTKDARRGGSTKYKFNKDKKMVKLSAIKEWCKRKGIPQGAAFPIARSIHEKGIKRSLFFSKPMRYMYPRFVDKYANAVSMDIAVNYANQIAKQLKTLNTIK